MQCKISKWKRICGVVGFSKTTVKACKWSNLKKYLISAPTAQLLHVKVLLRKKKSALLCHKELKFGYKMYETDKGENKSGTHGKWKQAETPDRDICSQTHIFERQPRNALFFFLDVTFHLSTIVVLSPGRDLTVVTLSLGSKRGLRWLLHWTPQLWGL